MFGRPADRVDDVDPFRHVTDEMDGLDRFPVEFVALVLKVLQREDKTPAAHFALLVQPQRHSHFRVVTGRRQTLQLAVLKLCQIFKNRHQDEYALDSLIKFELVK